MLLGACWTASPFSLAILQRRTIHTKERGELKICGLFSASIMNEAVTFSISTIGERQSLESFMITA